MKGTPGICWSHPNGLGCEGDDYTLLLFYDRSYATYCKTSFVGDTYTILGYSVKSGKVQVNQPVFDKYYGEKNLDCSRSEERSRT